MSRELHTHRKVSAALDQQSRRGQPFISELRDRMKDVCLSADAGVIHGGARVDVSSAIEQQPCGVDVAELGGHVQQRRALEQEAAAVSAAAVQFSKSPMGQPCFGIELLR